MLVTIGSGPSKTEILHNISYVDMPIAEIKAIKMNKHLKTDVMNTQNHTCQIVRT